MAVYIQPAEGLGNGYGPVIGRTGPVFLEDWGHHPRQLEDGLRWLLLCLLRVQHKLKLLSVQIPAISIDPGCTTGRTKQISFKFM